MYTHTTQTKTGGSVPLPRVGGALFSALPEVSRNGRFDVKRGEAEKASPEGEAALSGW